MVPLEEQHCQLQTTMEWAVDLLVRKAATFPAEDSLLKHSSTCLDSSKKSKFSP
jgi:hypothetical protein